MDTVRILIGDKDREVWSQNMLKWSSPCGMPGFAFGQGGGG